MLKRTQKIGFLFSKGEDLSAATTQKTLKLSAINETVDTERELSKEKAPKEVKHLVHTRED